MTSKYIAIFVLAGAFSILALIIYFEKFIEDLEDIDDFEIDDFEFEEKEGNSEYE